MVRRLTAALLCLMIPLALQAEESFISRAEGPVLSRVEGFHLIWAPLKRPMEQTNEKPFLDTNDELLTYAKARNILKDATSFRPEESLRLMDALLWLLRSRNVDAPQDIVESTLPAFLAYYPLVEHSDKALEENVSITRESLLGMIHTLDSFLREERHIVSFYAEEFAGRRTAFGEIFDPEKITAAHRYLPHNTLVRVHDQDSGRSIVVRINDRGPYIDGRDMDLSRAAFQKLAPPSRGILRNIIFERLGSADIVSACPAPRYQRRLGRTLLTPGIPTVAKKGEKIHLRANISFRLIHIRRPKGRPMRPREWTRRGETLTIELNRVGIYTLILHEDSGRRKRFRTKVVAACS